MTQEETDKIFYAITSNGCRDMDEIRFNQAVNEALDIVKNCSIPNVVGQSEQLPCEHNYQPDTTCGVDITCCTKCGDII